MVETQQQLDDSTNYDTAVDEDEDQDYSHADLPGYLTSSYLDECMLYGPDDPERIASAMSSAGQPVYR